MNYLFIGEDEFSKDVKIEKIKQELNLAKLDLFNFEIIYSKNLDLKTLQEKLLILPIKSRKRLILIKNASELSADIKQYLLSWFRKPFSHISLILDVRRINPRDHFFNQISRRVRLINFRQSKEINAFTLARQISYGKIKLAMRLLRQLLLQGERPEKILGALRYQLKQERSDLVERKKKLNLLLNCDIDIKTGRLKPEFALERLLIRLCYS